MKIEQVKVILTSPNQNYLFVKLITDSGVYGVGDASLNGQEHTVADFITSFLTPILIGRDPTQIEDFWQLVYRGLPLPNSKTNKNTGQNCSTYSFTITYAFFLLSRL